MIMGTKSKIEMETKTKGNMEIYNDCKCVPADAKTDILAGRMKGKTNINAQWRIEKLTEMFGVVGFGWKTKTLSKEIVDGVDGSKCCFIDIELYVKIDGEWSEAIEGSGGSSFIANEKNGKYVSDECFKMAFTDALSVACKQLGIGADVYRGFDESKYAHATTTTNTKNNTGTTILADRAAEAINKPSTPPTKTQSSVVDSQMLHEVKTVIWAASKKDVNRSLDLLEDFTSFKGKDGKQVKGIRDFNLLKDKRLETVHGKMKKMYKELYNELFPDNGANNDL